MTNHKNESGKHDNDGHHIIPLKVYFLVWGALIVGTIVTVITSYMDFGSWNILIAMAIATAKAMLVILYFMGLKYEGMENNVTFFGSFVFLGIFIGLTWIDIFYRPQSTPAEVDASSLMSSDGPIDVAALSKPSPDLVSKGKNIFGQQCMVCHGAGGKGDGPAAASLNPKPRNFSATDGWKNGRTVAKIFMTLTKGLNTMPAFASMSAEDRFSLAHYVRTLMPDMPAENAAELAEVKAMVGGQTPKLSYAQAIAKTASDPTIKPQGFLVSGVLRNSSASNTFGQQCMSCHGDGGRGGIAVHAVGVNPTLRLITKPLRVGSIGEFQKVVSEGIPGRGMPGFSTMSQGQLQELYQYVRNLR